MSGHCLENVAKLQWEWQQFTITHYIQPGGDHRSASAQTGLTAIRKSTIIGQLLLQTGSERSRQLWPPSLRLDCGRVQGGGGEGGGGEGGGGEGGGGGGGEGGEGLTYRPTCP